MAKRHHSSGINHHSDKFNDERKHEKDSMGAHLMHHNGEMYAGMASRRTQEMQDAGMIRENPAAIANLPQEVMIKPYPKNGPMMPDGLDDTLAGIDRQINYDDSQRRSHFYPKKV